MKALIIISLILTASCAQVQKSQIKQSDIDTYKKRATRLTMLNTKQGSKTELKALSLELIKLAKPIMTDFKKDHPECSNLMDLIMKKSHMMTKLSLSEIETQYHEGTALPESPDVCYEAKELIVHPATVAIITSKKSLNKELRTQVNDEIEEVLAHIDALVEL